MTADVLSDKTPITGRVQTFSTNEFRPQGHTIEVDDKKTRFLVHPHLLRPFELDVNLMVPVRVSLTDGVVVIEEWDPWSKQPIKDGIVVKRPPVVIGHIPVTTIITLAEAVAKQNQRCGKGCQRCITTNRSVLVQKTTGTMQAWCSCCYTNTDLSITTVFDGHNLLPHAPVAIRPITDGVFDRQVFSESSADAPQAPVENIIRLVEAVQQDDSCDAVGCRTKNLEVQKTVLLSTRGGRSILLCSVCFDSRLAKNPNTARDVVLDGRRIIMNTTVPTVSHKT